ncbi:MAG: Ig-like domain-containing protein, partial [Gemmatimonadota bacterium]
MDSFQRKCAAVLLVLATVAAGSCKSSPGGPDTSTPASVQVEPSTGLLVSVGDTLELTATVRNDAAQSISASVTWAVSPDGVVTVDANGRAVAVGNGVATVTASAGTASGTATVTVEQVVETVEASGDGQAADVTMPLDSSIVVTLLDARGNPVPDAPVSFTVVSGGGSVTPTDAATDADGSASAAWTLGTEAGLQEIDVVAGFADEATYRFGANGYALAAASLELYAGDAQSELVLTELAAPLQVQVLDTLGNGVAGVLVTFGVGGDAVLDSAETYTDLDGVASMGLTLGSALGAYAATASVADSLTESGTGLAGSPVGFTAEAVAYSVAAVAELVVGDTVTLTGTGFHPTLDANTVLLGGEAVPILSGSQTELTVEVPGFGCSPQRGMALDVSRAGEQVVQQVTVTPADALALAVGERRILSDAEAFCLQFLPASSDEYLVGLTSTSWFDGGATFALQAWDSLGPFAAPPPSTAGPSLASEAPTPVASAEDRLRAREQTLLEGLSDSGTTLTLAASSPEGSAPAGAPLEGDQLSLRLPDLRGDPCLDYVPVSAEVFWVGSR